MSNSESGSLLSIDESDGCIASDITRNGTFGADNFIVVVFGGCGRFIVYAVS